MPTKQTSKSVRLSSVILRTAMAAGEAVTIDREAGMIGNIAVITAGTTKVSGNGVSPFDVDLISLKQVADAINGSEVGVKSRMTHPELDGVDDLTCRLGYIRSARIVAGTVRADMHFHAPDSPDAVRLMDIAEKDPTSCGLSITSETATIEPLETTPTGLVLRVAAVDAVDWVGEPAANPAGMLSAQRRRRQHTDPLRGRLNLQESKTMNEKQLDFLRQVGLPFDASDEQTAEFIEALSDDQKAQFAALQEAEEVEQAAAAAEAAVATPATPVADKDETKPVAASVAQAPASTGVALTRDQLQDELKTSRQAERARATEIRKIALKCGYDEKWITKHVDDETAIEDVRRIALHSLSREPSNMATTSIQVGSDRNLDTLTQGVQDAIMLRAGRRQFVEVDQDGGVMLGADHRPKVRQAHERAMDFRGHTFVDMGRRYLIALGFHDADRMQRPALAKLLMNKAGLAAALPGVFMAHATGDFPFLLADTMGKVLRAEYALAPSTWELWCNRTTAPDFKDIKKIQLSEASDLVEIPEGEDYTFGTLTESQESYALLTYGKGLDFTRKMLINDDKSAFDRTPRMMGQSAKRLVEGLAVATLTANATLGDSIALFATGHGNLATGTLSVASLGAARKLMRIQTALGSSDPLELTPRYLIVPEALFTTASQLVSSAVDPALSNATPNPFANQLQVISSPRLDTDSAVKWYMLADPSQVDTVDVAFLEGQEAPMIEEKDEFDTGNRRLKITLDVVAKPIDHRGLVRSSGV